MAVSISKSTDDGCPQMHEMFAERTFNFERVPGCVESCAVIQPIDRMRTYDIDVSTKNAISITEEFWNGRADTRS